MSSSSSGIVSLCSLTNSVSVNSDMNSLGQQQQPEYEEDGDCLVRVDRRGRERGRSQRQHKNDGIKTMLRKTTAYKRQLHQVQFDSTL